MTACSCCGEERTEDRLAQLLCHQEVALCAVCVGWLGGQLADKQGAGLRRTAPIFVTTDVDRALAHYSKLGFHTEAYPGGGYGFAERDGVELHLAAVDTLDTAANNCACYLYVADAEGLHAEWRDAGVEGRLVEPIDTDYGLREGAHVDPDGNLLRFGSPIPGDDRTDDGEALIGADEPLAVAATSAAQAGDVTALNQLLVDNPSLATARIGDSTCSRTLLHAATDWPGNFPNVGDVIIALVNHGGDVNARFAGGHNETPLHWAASSDDVAALDALVASGADIEAPGAVLGGGTPLADAVGFGNWRAARRLVELGATTRLKDAAALGLMDRVDAAFQQEPLPDAETITRAFWSACHGNQLPAAQYLLDRGADINWIGWDDLTALDVAVKEQHAELAGWLRANGAELRPVQP